jgi:hypothetical protein
MKGFQEMFEKLGQAQMNDLYEVHAKHMRLVTKKQGEMTVLQDQTTKLQNLVAVQHEEAAVEKSKVDSLNSEVNRLTQEQRSLPGDITALKQTQITQKQALQVHKQEYAAMVKDKDHQVEELTSAIVCYREHLGLEFNVVRDGMNIAFKYIDAKAPSTKFSFALNVNDDNQYEVNKCTPAAGDVTTLVNKLNADNNFAYFVQAMRRQIKQGVQNGMQ